ncbi:MAG TPA: DUF305 domain-containing protein [Actinoplanes sp.]|nr:DUF305 domain-containing protein [Actinoplanes sp.]
MSDSAPAPASGTPDAAGPAGADDAAETDGQAVVAGGRPRFGAGWLIGAIVFGIVIGLAAGLLVPRFLRPGDDSAEAGFLRDMSSHHAQAVEMAMIVHARSDDAQISTLGADIALTQHAQIGYMQAWLRDWDLAPTGTRPAMAWMPDGQGSLVDGLMPGMAAAESMTKLRAATGKELDIQFLELMRQHHLGGIHMAQGLLKLSDHEDVSWLATTMVNGQQNELALIDMHLARIKAAP